MLASLPGRSRKGAREAALARPRNLVAYSAQRPRLSRLAAAYGFALARGHCFPDGNKRLALAIMDVFLQLNGRELTASEADAVITIRDLAAGKLDEETLVAWVETNSGDFRAAD
ncbi:MAG: type II toxin-antitoxin system death-on-curing family toxin [Gammaproteobacteria bacterium]